MIVLLGDLLLDLFALPLGAPVDAATSFAPRQGGGTANVAVVLGRCGVRCALWASVGRDAHGDRLLAAVRDAGVDARGVVRVAGATGVVFIAVDASGERSFMGYGGGAEKALSAGDLLAGAPALEGARWLHLGSGAIESGPMADAARTLVEDARRREVPLSVDLNVRRHRWPDAATMLAGVGWLAGQAAVVRASEDDLLALGLEPSLASLSALSPSAVSVLTHGPRGASAHVGSLELRSEAVPAQAVDTTGAGDAFTAGLLAVLARQGARPGTAMFTDAALWTMALRAGNTLGSRAVAACGSTHAFRDGVDLDELGALGCSDGRVVGVSVCRSRCGGVPGGGRRWRLVTSGALPLHPRRGAAPAPRPREKGLAAPSLLAISHPGFVHCTRRFAWPHAPWGPVCTRVSDCVRARRCTRMHEG
jgi:fructokinase